MLSLIFSIVCLAIIISAIHLKTTYINKYIALKKRVKDLDNENKQLESVNKILFLQINIFKKIIQVYEKLN